MGVSGAGKSSGTGDSSGEKMGTMVLEQQFFKKAFHAVAKSRSSFFLSAVECSMV